MTKRTLTAVIIRLAGIGLLIKLFDFFGSYFMSLYLSSQLWVGDRNQRIDESFDKLFFSGTFLFFLNLFLVIFLLTSADWIAKKIVKSDADLKIDLTAKSVMSIVISTIGLLWVLRALYILPDMIYDTYKAVSHTEPISFPYMFYMFSVLAVRVIVGLYVILKVNPISNYLLRKMKLPE
ncbi:MAG: hypothetical protein ACI837_002503 [Crocinitomicaceae bacterium]|jgi:hypothetical protein